MSTKKKRAGQGGGSISLEQFKLHQMRAMIVALACPRRPQPLAPSRGLATSYLPKLKKEEWDELVRRKPEPIPWVWIIIASVFAVVILTTAWPLIVSVAKAFGAALMIIPVVLVGLFELVRECGFWPIAGAIGLIAFKVAIK